jgi:hypothetical protein
MSKWEDDLPPRIKERLAQIGDLTPEEKQRMKDLEQLDGLVSDYFKGELSGDDFWQKLNEYKKRGSVDVLAAAQIKLIETLRLGSNGEELAKRREGVLAIESLKDEQNMPLFEQGFDAITGLQSQHSQEKDQVYNSLKAQVEQDPKLRMQQIQQGGQTMMMQLNVEDAIKMNPQYKNFLTQHEAKYSEAFVQLINGFKAGIK